MSIQGHVRSPEYFNADLIRLLRNCAQENNLSASVRGKYDHKEGCWVVEIDAPSDDDIDTVLMIFALAEGVRFPRID